MMEIKIKLLPGGKMPTKGIMMKNNAVCPICGKEFHVKPSHLKRYKTVCCSKECSRKPRSIYMSGEGNHQYGLKGDKNASFKGMLTQRKNSTQLDAWIYCPEHPYARSDGRVKLHRYIVEQNADYFDRSFFDEVNNHLYLRKDLFVHHIDGNHDNNNIENLQVVTKAEHRRLHNKMHPRPKDYKTGRFIKEK